ncbi:DUF7691 family protein [Nocardia sp. NPDC055321]
MGRFVRIYVVDLAKAVEAIGLGDDRLRRMIETRFEDEFAHVNENFRSYDEQPTPAEAVHAVINGGPYADGEEHWYTNAFETICEFYAEYVDRHEPYRRGRLAQVDERLNGIGVDIRLTAFEGGYPAPLSNTGGGYGEWSHESCVRACSQWDALTPEQLATLDDDTREWADRSMQWARKAASSPGRGVAGFSFTTGGFAR